MTSSSNYTADAYSQITITEFPLASKYYYELLKFLEYHTDRNQQSISTQRRNARDKLTRLSKQQFQELSTDVYDEATRRQANNMDVPFLPVRDDFHPKRNQARQKLATLPKNRFHDLAADVFFELEVRFPILLQVTQNFETIHVSKSPSPPIPNELAQSDQSQNTASINFNNLDTLMADLGNLMVKNQMTSGSPNMNDTSSIDPDSAFRQEYESKIMELTDNLNSLQDKFNTQSKHLEELTSRNIDLEAELQLSRETINRLQLESNTHQQILKDTQSETSRLSMQLKAIMNENQELRKQSMMSQSSSVGGGFGGGDWRQHHQDSRLIVFKQTVNELMQSLDSPQRTDVLMSMKRVVFACKSITEEVEQLESDPNSKLSVPQREDVLTCKTELTTALTTLMAAAKDHAENVENTNSISDIERSASTLLNIMNTLAGILNLHPSASLSQASYSVGSPNKTPMPNTGSGGSSSSSSIVANFQGKITSLSTLQQFLEHQTNQIVIAIQSLLISMRSNLFNNEFLNTVNQIDRVVKGLNDQCRFSFAQPFATTTIGQEGTNVLDQLLLSNEQLSQYAVDIANDMTMKPSKQKIASASYEVAKYTKQLVGLVEQAGG